MPGGEERHGTFLNSQIVFAPIARGCAGTLAVAMPSHVQQHVLTQHDRFYASQAC